MTTAKITAVLTLWALLMWPVTVAQATATTEAGGLFWLVVAAVLGLATGSAVVQLWLHRRPPEPPEPLVPTIDPDRYHLGYASPDGRTQVWDLDGIGWHDAPIPPRDHRCWAQTQGHVNLFIPVQRCPCGARRCTTGETWDLRNSRTGTDYTKKVPR